MGFFTTLHLGSFVIYKFDGLVIKLNMKIKLVKSEFCETVLVHTSFVKPCATGFVENEIVRQDY